MDSNLTILLLAIRSGCPNKRGIMNSFFITVAVGAAVILAILRMIYAKNQREIRENILIVMLFPHVSGLMSAQSMKNHSMLRRFRIHRVKTALDQLISDGLVLSEVDPSLSQEGALANIQIRLTENGLSTAQSTSEIRSLEERLAQVL